MLEKIGLPAKPSMRGGVWVVDASHCQGCSSQFTFINRKHHCRRCGGLFCNSCTQQRMILRGQGDSPVRICDPCKKLEDAARFELRYGHKSRSVKDTEGKQQFLSHREPHSDGVSDLQRASSSASSLDFASEAVTPEGKRDDLRSTTAELHDNTMKEMGSISPEELRQHAAEEKKKYRILKAEGKPEVALQAFKRGKDLERQAGALEIALRKNRRKAASLHNSASSQMKNDAREGSLGKKNIASQSSGVVKDDLLSELRELGWSDVDLHDAEKKPEKLSLEGELSNIIKEIPSKSNVARGSSGIDNSQVLAHKKKALMLKREGKLAEAKEELKKAKILEKQLEEQELLGQADDSDDELLALIQGMDDEQDDPLADDGHDLHVNFDHLSRLDDLVFDDNFDVTNDDMNDPEIAAALRSFGWSEQDDRVEEEASQSVPSREALEIEVLTLKREALNKKRAGNTAEAMALLKKAKLLEKDLDTAQTEPSPPQKKLMQQMSGQASMPEVDDENVTEVKISGQSKPKSKFLIQRELLALKKKALALRREGRTDEADEELKKGKELERQLQEMENTPKPMSTKADGVKKDGEHASLHQDISADLGFNMEGEAAEVTEEDMSDPAMLSVLKNLGWVDEHVESASNPRVSSKQTNDASTQETGPSRVLTKVPRNKTEIQRELLGIKRKALALRRQGKTKEAEDELEKAKSLEKEVAEMESQQLPEPLEIKTDVFSDSSSKEKSEALIPIDGSEVMKTSSIKSTISKDEVSAKDINDVDLENGCATSVPPPTLSDRLTIRIHKLESSSTGIVDSQEKSSDQTDSLTGNDSNSQTSILKPTNKLGRLPSIPSLEHETPGLQSDARGNTKGDQSESAGVLNAYTVDKKQTENTTMKQDPNKEANTEQGSESLNDQILARKKKAVALKREGKLAEAREELRQAKLLEKSLEEGKHHVSEASQNILVSTSSSSSAVSDSKHQKPMSGRDRLKLQQESLAHKRQALKLRREGRIEESDAELELAKALEAQLEEVDSQNSNNRKGAVDDVIVEDLLDPQLLSALKSIGWGESDMAIHPQEKSASKSISKNINSSSQPEAKSNIPKTTNISPEKATLEEQINAEKVRALNLKRAGKQAEALEALRAAKRLEKRLISLA